MRRTLLVLAVSLSFSSLGSLAVNATTTDQPRPATVQHIAPATADEPAVRGGQPSVAPQLPMQP
jgi:hypothetical protein